MSASQSKDVKTKASWLAVCGLWLLFLINIALLLNSGHWIIKFAPVQIFTALFLAQLLYTRNRPLFKVLFVFSLTQCLVLFVVNVAHHPWAEIQTHTMLVTTSKLDSSQTIVRLKFKQNERYYFELKAGQIRAQLPDTATVKIQVNRPLVGPATAQIVQIGDVSVVNSMKLGSTSHSSRKDSAITVTSGGYGWRNHTRGTIDPLGLLVD